MATQLRTHNVTQKLMINVMNKFITNYLTKNKTRAIDAFNVYS